MERKNRIRSTAGNQRGAVAILVGLMLALFVAVTAMAVDVGYLMAAKNELQNVADASALAAARRLGVIYEAMPYSQQRVYNLPDPDAALIRAAASGVALQNRAGGINITLLDADIEIGSWDQTRTRRFIPNTDPAYTDPPNAVRVTSRREAGANNPVSLFFARIFGIQDTAVNAFATAALTGSSTAGPGGLPIPIGIPTRWFQNPNFCDSSINFYPPCNREPCDTAEGCAGYHVYTDSPANTNFIANTIMPGIPLPDNTPGAYRSPETFAGETEFNYTGGTLAALMNPPDYPFQTLFNTMKTRNDNITDFDNNPNTWTAEVVVYESNTCANPNQSLLVVGFVTIVIEDIIGPPNPTVKGRVLCDSVRTGRGGGGNYGTMGSIPGLVE